MNPLPLALQSTVVLIELSRQIMKGIAIFAITIHDRLVGLVVRRPPRERKIPGSGFFRGRVIPVT